MQLGKVYKSHYMYLKECDLNLDYVETNINQYVHGGVSNIRAFQ